MSIFSERIQTGNDDGYKVGSGSWQGTSNIIETGRDTNDIITALRFTGVTISSGSTISNATITIRFNSGLNNSQTLKVYGIDEDNTETFSSDPTARSQTTANVSWSVTGGESSGTDVVSPNISSVIQEIIDRGGWSSGNAIGLFINNNGSEYAHDWISYEGSIDYCALLSITYTSGTTTSVTTTSTTTTSTSITTTSTTTTTMPIPPEIYGIKVLRDGVVDTSTGSITRLRDYYLNSRRTLLKIHKQGPFSMSFMGEAPGGGASDVTIEFPELKYRPFVLVYMQRMTHTPSVDTNYHLLDWSYFGATQAGENYTKIYNNKIVISYYDQDASLDEQQITALYGYYYIFAEEVRE
jgi:hypothetical protein